MTQVASPNQGEGVLSMTCQVKVIASDSTITQVRALVNSAASTLLISEGLAK